MQVLFSCNVLRLKEEEQEQEQEEQRERERETDRQTDRQRVGVGGRKRRTTPIV